jgi:hypothetical protein
MGANVYSQQTSSAREKFTHGQTTTPRHAAIVVCMGQRLYFFAKWGDRLGFRQVHIVKATGLSPGYISQLWSNKYDKEPTIDTLRKIADAMGGIHFAAFEFDPDSVQGRVFAAMVEPKGRRARR